MSDNRRRIHDNCIEAIEHIKFRYEKDERITITFVEASKKLADYYYWMDIGTIAHKRMTKWGKVKKNG